MFFKRPSVFVFHLAALQIPQQKQQSVSIRVEVVLVQSLVLKASSPNLFLNRVNH